MLGELHFGGISFKGLIKALVPDLWMVVAITVIAWISLGIVGNMSDETSYATSAIVAVYPFNQMYTLEASSSALETVAAANQVFNSEMFRTGLNGRMPETADAYLYSQHISGTYILMLSVTASSPENAYKTLQAAMDYYKEISPHLVGDNHLEILRAPDFPLPAVNESKILKYRPLLALFAGFATLGSLALLYVLRKTYKTVAAISRFYKDVRFFRASSPLALRKTAVQLQQMLRAMDCKSIYVTSAVKGEGIKEITSSLTSLLKENGRSLVVVAADELKIQNDFSDLAEEVKTSLDQAKDLANLVIVDGGSWTGSRDDEIWKKATDASLAICRRDKADFYSIDRMMTDLKKGDPAFLGCVLYEF